MWIEPGDLVALLVEALREGECIPPPAEPGPALQLLKVACFTCGRPIKADCWCVATGDGLRSRARALRQPVARRGPPPKWETYEP